MDPWPESLAAKLSAVSSVSATFLYWTWRPLREGSSAQDAVHPAFLKQQESLPVWCVRNTE